MVGVIEIDPIGFFRNCKNKLLPGISHVVHLKSHSTERRVATPQDEEMNAGVTDESNMYAFRRSTDSGKGMINALSWATQKTVEASVHIESYAAENSNSYLSRALTKYKDSAKRLGKFKSDMGKSYITESARELPVAWLSKADQKVFLALQAAVKANAKQLKEEVSKRLGADKPYDLAIDVIGKRLESKGNEMDISIGEDPSDRSLMKISVEH